MSKEEEEGDPARAGRAQAGAPGPRRRHRGHGRSGRIDTIRIQRLKKRKLVLKDRIAALEDRILPDIIA